MGKWQRTKKIKQLQVEKKDYGIRVCPLSIAELQKQGTHRKMYIIWQMIDYKIDPTRVIYTYVNASDWYVLMWQPVNPNYQPEEFTVTNEWKEYKFTKSLDLSFNTSKNDYQIDTPQSNESNS